MTDVDYAAALISENRALAETIFAAELTTPVPTCPGWTLLQLMRHVGRGDRWAAQIIATGAGADLDPRTVPDGRPPDDLDGAREWLQSGPVKLLDAVAAVGAATSVATFLGPQPASWWTRRRLHEATVHRADAALATGQPYELRPELASDGIEEWLERLTIELPRRDVAAIEDTQTLTLAAKDAATSWTIRGHNGGIEWGRGDALTRADVQLSGPASGLLLALTRRCSQEAAGVDLDGDAGVWNVWLANTPF